MKRILVPMDLSDDSRSLVRFVFPFARRHGLHHIDFLQVEEEEDIHIPEISSPEEKTSLEKLKLFVERSIEPSLTGNMSFNVLSLRGISEEEIIKRTKEMPYAMIVIARDMASQIGSITGRSLARKIMDEATCNIMIYIPRKTRWMVQY
jgi:nucleotide-binding universal stress UspA family protein